VFGSEAKAVLEHPATPRDIDDDAFADYLTFGFSPPPATLFRGVSKLGPGERMVVTADGAVTTETWWDPMPPTDVAERAFAMSEDDVRAVLTHPGTMIGTDGVPAVSGKPHPRFYGTFARILGHYVRDEKLLTLENAIHRMTGLPAAKFHLADRGRVGEGAYADLVVFDPSRVADRTTYLEPRVHPDGIEHVIVNGGIVVANGRHTGRRQGRVLRHRCGAAA